MLVLSRKKNESLTIDGQTNVKVLSIKGRTARLLFSGPLTVVRSGREWKVPIKTGNFVVALKAGETVSVGYYSCMGSISLTRILGKNVKLGVSLPREVHVKRAEIV